jgi:hypothetical protein
MIQWPIESDKTNRTDHVSTGGGLTLVNGSPFDWALDNQHSYQLDTWEWPTINSGVNSSEPGVTLTLTTIRPSLKGLR